VIRSPIDLHAGAHSSSDSEDRSPAIVMDTSTSGQHDLVGRPPSEVSRPGGISEAPGRRPELDRMPPYTKREIPPYEYRPS
jgi:hypothetical protein